MGATQQLPEQDRFLYERNYLLDRIKVMMGGRAAEQYKLNTLTSGAENDLKQAQHLARKMVLDWGMSEQFENVALGGEEKAVFLGEDISRKREYSEETTRMIDEEVKQIITNAYNEARKILESHKEALDQFAERLLEEEDIPGKEIYDYLENNSKSA